MDQEFTDKYCGIKDIQMSCDIIKTDFGYLHPSKWKILNFEAS